MDLRDSESCGMFTRIVFDGLVKHRALEGK